MDKRRIVNMPDESDDDRSSDEIDDSDADADFILENSDSETSVVNYTDQPTCSQSMNNFAHEQVFTATNTI